MANKPIDLPPVMAKIRAAFIARDPDYLPQKWSLAGRLEELNARMNALIGTPLKLPISQQISLEAQWLINYTDDRERAKATLDRLEASLTAKEQPLLQQDDGSWGYIKGANLGAFGMPSGSMTCAGIASLVISGLKRDQGREAGKKRLRRTAEAGDAIRPAPCDAQHAEQDGARPLVTHEEGRR